MYAMHEPKFVTVKTTQKCPGIWWKQFISHLLERDLRKLFSQEEKGEIENHNNDNNDDYLLYYFTDEQCFNGAIVPTTRT